MNFQEMLNQQLSSSSYGQQDDNTTTDFVKRIKDPINISGKHPFTGRVMPPAQGHDWFGKLFDRIWVNYNGRVMPVIIDVKDKDDKLAEYALELVNYNYHVSDKSQIVKLNPKDPFGFSIEHKAEFVGMPTNPNNDQPYISEQGTPVLNNYICTATTYNMLLQKLRDPASLFNGQPWQSEFKFITTGATYPLTIHLLDKTHYQVDFAMGHVLQPMNPQFKWDARNRDNTNYAYFDDFEVFDKPLRLASPSFYKTLTDYVHDFLVQNGVIREQTAYTIMNDTLTQAGLGGIANQVNNNMGYQAPPVPQSNYQAPQAPVQSQAPVQTPVQSTAPQVQSQAPVTNNQYVQPTTPVNNTNNVPPVQQAQPQSQTPVTGVPLDNNSNSGLADIDSYLNSFDDDNFDLN